MMELRLVVVVIVLPGDLPLQRRSTAPPLPRTSAIDRRRADPLPSPADLAAAALALAGADVAVLLDHTADALPDLLALAQGVDGAQDVVAQVREEQPRVVTFGIIGIAAVPAMQLLLAREPLEHEVDQRGHLGGHGAVGPDAAPRPEDRDKEANHSANLEAISRQSEADRASDRAGEGKASERGGREVGVWNGGGIGISKVAVGVLVSFGGEVRYFYLMR